MSLLFIQIVESKRALLDVAEHKTKYVIMVFSNLFGRRVTAEGQKGNHFLV